MSVREVDWTEGIAQGNLQPVLILSPLENCLHTETKTKQILFEISGLLRALLEVAEFFHTWVFLICRILVANKLLLFTRQFTRMRLIFPSTIKLF